MEVMAVLIGLAVVATLGERWGVDSRPGVGDSRTDRRERWAAL